MIKCYNKWKTVYSLVLFAFNGLLNADLALVLDRKKNGQTPPPPLWPQAHYSGLLLKGMGSISQIRSLPNHICLEQLRSLVHPRLFLHTNVKQNTLHLPCRMWFSDPFRRRLAFNFDISSLRVEEFASSILCAMARQKYGSSFSQGTILTWC